MQTQLYERLVDKHREEILAAEDYIWRHPETGFREWKTTAYMQDVFEKVGYTLVRAGDIPGFYTDIETGRPGPKLLIMAELDALSAPNHVQAVDGCAHACGHHAQCAAMAGIALALKEPGALDGLSVDLAFLFHTSTRTDCDFDCHYGQNGCIAKTVRYEGVAAHAGGSPEKGVNALYAASLGLQGINAIRETLRDGDHIRIHPIMTAGGACVNIIPCEATLESYIRGASFDAILDANRKVDRALAAGALALGARVSVSDRPGYAPLVNSPELVEAAGEAMRALLGADRVKITNEWTTGCTDMGDVSCIMPVLHPHIAGAAGKSHGDDYHLVDREMACVNSAKGQLLLMALLLENGAARAKQVVERYHAPYESKAAYFAALDAILRDRELIEYHEDTAQIRL